MSRLGRDEAGVTDQRPFWRNISAGIGRVLPVQCHRVTQGPLFILDLQIKMRFMRNQSTGFYLAPVWDQPGHKEEDAGFCCIYVCQDKWICQVGKSFVVRFPDSNKSKTIIKISLCLSELEQPNPPATWSFIFEIEKIIQKRKGSTSCYSMFYNLETKAGPGAILEESLSVCLLGC